jgi:hypothetical protein
MITNQQRKALLFIERMKGSKPRMNELVAHSVADIAAHFRYRSKPISYSWA